MVQVAYPFISKSYSEEVALGRVEGGIYVYSAEQNHCDRFSWFQSFPHSPENFPRINKRKNKGYKATTGKHQHMRSIFVACSATTCLRYKSTARSADYIYRRRIA